MHKQAARHSQRARKSKIQNPKPKTQNQNWNRNPSSKSARSGTKEGLASTHVRMRRVLGLFCGLCVRRDCTTIANATATTGATTEATATALHIDLARSPITIIKMHLNIAIPIANSNWNLDYIQHVCRNQCHEIFNALRWHLSWWPV